MRIIAVSTLKAFWEQPAYMDSEGPLKAWHEFAKKANWSSPDDIKADFRKATYVKGNRVVFDIGGNKYRLIVKINYPYGRIYIRFIGTHKQYDAIDAETV